MIVAGYPDLMHEFLESNPGLRSRFSREITFPDYDVDELVRIAHVMATDAEYSIAPEADEVLRAILAEARRDPGFGNGRFVRNLFEQAIGRHAVRLAAGEDDPGHDDLTTITAADLASAAALLR